MRLAILAVALVVALGLAALAAAVVPPAIALPTAIAVYGAALATFGQLSGALQAWRDASDLQAEATLESYGPRSPGSGIVQVRLYNRGRRPVRVEEVGLWAEESAIAPHFPGWGQWADRMVSPIPKTLTESDSVRAIAWPGWIASWYARHDPPRWVFADPAHGKRRWWRLPDDVRDALAAAWPEAQEAYRNELAAEAARPGEVDGGGQPLRQPGRHSPAPEVDDSGNPPPGPIRRAG